MADSTDDTTPSLGSKIVFTSWLSFITLGLAIMIALPLMGR